MHYSVYRLHECKTCRSLFNLLTYGIVGLPAFLGLFHHHFAQVAAIHSDYRLDHIRCYLFCQIGRLH